MQSMTSTPVRSASGSSSTGPAGGSLEAARTKFAVVNDGSSSYDSHLLIDNVQLNREFGDGYQVVDTQVGGIFETVVQV